ncbi:hypothetical protein A2865_04690 [Candidatus Woesebacteria bacterium RIFCSPHIGHO2_01_FULL_39_17]|uniref:Nucleotide-diphospho-sugar transferase domain-containing protein n=2 Tax=Candidatus Woeseibacteriota TaxID=1752722 RepID=A0A0G0NB21_9BACT|nr:MAG: hypothetical protein UT19_C0001G0095 [Candidatus Woesebacteria bacterium GW2011_GWB1_39_10b]KKR13359.1 MAG: hypothetical protein UT40_C0018G0004 [Candidatus Woesebacteria bacterium GW2011_GWA1_39_21b]KKS89689.1 MAG: hypothetical protein UV64_C0002G0023 [Parcubacteria group bacterium GW2011_GWC1_43_11b]OGM24316.1 MAG: hypothetical protein A2865_04690 [Candidatus Woesebacteria bacterium RIFCSPHIGHO2_01_FULL_39_17]
MSKTKNISFVTPYLSGTKWLELHLASIRKFHLHADIVISAPDESARKIVERFGGRYFDNNRDYFQAIAFLFETAKHDTIVLSDCDTVLFAKIDYLAAKLKDFDLVGIEERIRHATKDRWFRFAPGYTDLTFIIFSRAKARANNPSWPHFPPFTPTPKNQNNEDHYTFCELMSKHYYLRPYTTTKYGLGNLIRDGDKNILWHQWFGSWEKRASFISEREREDNPYKNMAELIAAESRFLADYPQLDFSQVKKAFE